MNQSNVSGTVVPNDKLSIFNDAEEILRITHDGVFVFRSGLRLTLEELRGIGKDLLGAIEAIGLAYQIELNR